MHKRVALALVLLLGFAPFAIPDKTEKAYAEYTFARVRFHLDPFARGGINYEGQPPWEHDYPKSEDFFLTIVSQVTGIHTSPDAYAVVDLDDEEIFRYPFLYFSEPGYMDLTGDETENLRQFFNRGGFAMFDDMRGQHFPNLQLQMKAVFPDRDMVQIQRSHPMLRAYYEIESLEMVPPYPDAVDPTFWGLSDDEGRLIVIANVANDFGEYWEDIDNGNRILQPAVQSFQFGVNYLIYALTH